MLYFRLNGLCYREYFGRQFTECGQWYSKLNVVCYSEQYEEYTAQQLDRCIAGSLECVELKIMWKVLHSRWTVVLLFECSVLQ